MNFEKLFAIGSERRFNAKTLRCQDAKKDTEKK